MGLFRHVSVALLLALVCGSRAAHAQGLNGTLVGTVKDAQGGVIPGALVQILSPALIGGARETTTSDRGQWLLPILPPGDYTLTVDLSPRFRPAGLDPGRCRAETVPESEYGRDRYRDLTSNLGGPVWRDRLWFFSAYQYLRDYDSQPASARQTTAFRGACTSPGFAA
jgi:Carboxypeptidase regulatory-like domain